MGQSFRTSAKADEILLTGAFAALNPSAVSDTAVMSTGAGIALPDPAARHIK